MVGSLVSDLQHRNAGAFFVYMFLDYSNSGDDRTLEKNEM
jgi:hypothetical protein